MRNPKREPPKTVYSKCMDNNQTLKKRIFRLHKAAYYDFLEALKTDKCLN